MDALKIYTETDFTKELKWDSSLRLIFILRGELSIHTGTVLRHLYLHDFTFIMPYEMYGGCITDGCKAYIVEAGPELWENICPDADKLNFTLRILKANDNYTAYTSICKALAQILHYGSSQETTAPARICKAVCDIIAILIEDFAESRRFSRPGNQAPDRIQGIISYISQNYSRKFSLEEIAGDIGFHPQYFSAYFKKYFGTGFSDYLNTYRVNKSSVLLRQTGDSIMNIALACGFNNHKTYSNAFERVYGCTPREYRKRLGSISGRQEVNADEGDFDYLRRFWSRADQDTGAFNSSRIKCNIIQNTDKVLFENRSHNMVSVGRAMSCLRSDMQQQLKAAKKDLDLEYVRIRDVFSDDLFVYYVDMNKTPVYSYRSLDEIFDFLISTGLKPFIEIGYMPGQLASKKQFAGWQYHPNVSAPKSLAQWGMLVSSFINHLISRYGRNEVEGWLFDFWTSPNLPIENGYWNESMEKFFQFYMATYDVIKRSDPKIKFGSPNFSYPGGIGWYKSFLDFAVKHAAMPDFISIHLYGCDDGLDSPGSSFMKFSVFDKNYSIPNLRPDKDNIPNAVRELNALLEKNGGSGLPIVIDDWNITFWPTDFTRDICFMAPFVVDSYFNTCRNVFGMGFASLSDIHEDFFNTDQLFNGGPGLLTFTGIPKASYHALGMAHRFSRRILQRGNNFVVGKTDFGYELLIYNMDFYNDSYAGNDPSIISLTNRYTVFEGVPALDCHIEIAAPKGTYSITRSTISRQNGSSYDVWNKMGSPADMTPEMSEYLRRVSTPDMNYQIKSFSDKIILDETVEPHGVMHIEISRM